MFNINNCESMNRNNWFEWISIDRLFFFLYFRCHAQGTSCPYRHEPTALGHERVCPKWMVGTCVQQNCPERHMVIEKARNQIQCYWEQKPTGCRKPHCVFKHTAKLVSSINPNGMSTPLIQM